MERRMSGDLRYARDITKIEIKIKVAKEAVVKACIDGHKRKWLGSVQLCPYATRGGNHDSHRVEFWALEGTPMRGIVIVNYATNQVMAFDIQGKRLKVIVKIKDIERH